MVEMLSQHSRFDPNQTQPSYGATSLKPAGLAAVSFAPTSGQGNQAHRTGSHAGVEIYESSSHFRKTNVLLTQLSADILSIIS